MKRVARTLALACAGLAAVGCGGASGGSTASGDSDNCPAGQHPYGGDCYGDYSGPAAPSGVSVAAMDVSAVRLAYTNSEGFDPGLHQAQIWWSTTSASTGFLVAPVTSPATPPGDVWGITPASAQVWLKVRYCLVGTKPLDDAGCGGFSNVVTVDLPEPSLAAPSNVGVSTTATNGDGSYVVQVTWTNNTRGEHETFFSWAETQVGTLQLLGCERALYPLATSTTCTIRPGDAAHGKDLWVSVKAQVGAAWTADSARAFYAHP